MVYPVCKAPRGRVGKDGGRGDDVGREGNREKEDGGAQWQDVSAERAKPSEIQSPKRQRAVLNSGSGPDQVEEPSKEHKVGPSQEVAGQGARHQPDDQRRSKQR